MFWDIDILPGLKAEDSSSNFVALLVPASDGIVAPFDPQAIRECPSLGFVHCTSSSSAAEVLPGNLLAGTTYFWFQRTKQGFIPVENWLKYTARIAERQDSDCFAINALYPRPVKGGVLRRERIKTRCVG